MFNLEAFKYKGLSTGWQSFGQRYLKNKSEDSTNTSVFMVQENRHHLTSMSDYYSYYRAFFCDNSYRELH